jgi:hypothetical protein
MTVELHLFCLVCGQDRPAELPLCDDAHEDERVCLDCSAALFVDPIVIAGSVASIGSARSAA